jgi:hypothetical protein
LYEVNVATHDDSSRASLVTVAAFQNPSANNGRRDMITLVLRPNMNKIVSANGTKLINGNTSIAGWTVKLAQRPKV